MKDFVRKAINRSKTAKLSQTDYIILYVVGAIAMLIAFIAILFVKPIMTSFFIFLCAMCAFFGTGLVIVFKDDLKKKKGKK